MPSKIIIYILNNLIFVYLLLKSLREIKLFDFFNLNKLRFIFKNLLKLQFCLHNHIYLVMRNQTCENKCFLQVAMLNQRKANSEIENKNTILRYNHFGTI